MKSMSDWQPKVRSMAEEVGGPLHAHLGHFTAPEIVQAGHNTTRTKPGRPKKSAAIVQQAFHEVMHNTPSTVKRAKVSPARKQRMKVAIALSKARAAGARIPKKKGT